MSLMLYGFNVVLQRKSLDRAISGGSASFIRRASDKRIGALCITSDAHLVAVRFADTPQLEVLVKNLLHYDLNMTTDGKFADFALVHAMHGLAMACNWLEYEPAGDSAIVWMKGEPREPACYVSPEPSADSVDWAAISDSEALTETFWLTQIGRGFVLRREDGYNEWLDFNSGRVIVNFLPNESSTIQ